MKKLFVTVVSVLSCLSVGAQTMNVHKTDGTVLRFLADEVEYVDFSEKSEATPPVNVKAVDIGLDVKWANMNVGAENPEDYGDYFAWGETAPKTEFTWKNYKWSEGTYDSITKYGTVEVYGVDDHILTLEPEDDAATVNWGKEWRMPTEEEVTALLSYCQWETDTLNGVTGFKVTGRNGNSIFLPFVGWYGDLGWEGKGEFGHYWSASILEDYCFFGRDLYFSPYMQGMDYGKFRCFGQCIRPVLNESK